MILGIDLKRGDEVIITNQNYARMVTTWKQRARRDGIVVREVSFPVPLTDPGVLVRAIEAAITPRTRAIELPHITNLTGQVLPIRDIVRLARPHGIQVFVDGGMPSPTCRSSATIWSATTAPPRCTSGCMRRSARVSCTCAATGFRCCGR
jgi:O-acetylhomoserine/O-acetylserine sulfhydrylase-like pyridoxal-dependent enzyme